MRWLETYNRNGHAVGLSVLKLSDFLTRVNTTRNHIAQDVRNKIAPILAGQELIQQRMRDGVAELAINYRKSAIVAEHKVTLLKRKPLDTPIATSPNFSNGSNSIEAPERETGHRMRTSPKNPAGASRDCSNCCETQSTNCFCLPVSEHQLVEIPILSK